MSKSTGHFLVLSTALVLLAACVLIIFGSIYRRSSLAVYNLIVIFFMTAIVLFILLLLLSIPAVLYVYRKKHISGVFTVPVKLGLKLLLPMIIFISGIFKGKKDLIRSIYVEINNILVGTGLRKYAPSEVLVLLPHCLQNSQCTFKITNSIENCKKCGKCCIGEIASMAEELGVNTLVVTGGTVARNIVSALKPSLILSVACERDLALGIADVNTIPVLGIINERPFGPCHDTKVDVGLIRTRLKEILTNGG